jgi:hypothetical protein
MDVSMHRYSILYNNFTGTSASAARLSGSGSTRTTARDHQHVDGGIDTCWEMDVIACLLFNIALCLSRCVGGVRERPHVVCLVVGAIHDLVPPVAACPRRAGTVCDGIL